VSLERALGVFEAKGALTAPVESQAITRGLLNETHAVRDATGSEFIAQRLNPVFDPAVNDNILRVTQHLALRGVPTFRIVTVDGAPALDLGDNGLWRLLTRLPGESFDRPRDRAQVLEAGRAFGALHRALFDFDEPLHPLGFPFHETQTHFMELAAALRANGGHDFYGEVARLANEILEASRTLPRFDALPQRVVHGDLKLNNLLFDTDADGAARVCGIIDLDTVSRLPLAYDWGDAMRSWCNRSREDTPEAELDLDYVAAAAEGLWSAFADGTEHPSEEEVRSLGAGLEVIALELCARFATDILQESYFAWDETRYGRAAEHNLFRARGQLSLYRQACDSRDERARAIPGA
jgi:thiamine kinase-like enzyme